MASLIENNALVDSSPHMCNLDKTSNLPNIPLIKGKNMKE